MGKTNLHELSSGWTSVNAAFGTVHNPYDTSRVPGGSSGGVSGRCGGAYGASGYRGRHARVDSHSVYDVRHLRPASDLQVGPDLKATFAAPAPPKEVDDAMVAQRQKARDALPAHFKNENIVALAFPPAMISAHKFEEDGSIIVRGERVSITTTIGRNVSLSSFASLASLVLPAGLTASGLPVGLEFDALPGTDRQLLGLGVSLQRALGSVQAPPV